MEPVHLNRREVGTQPARQSLGSPMPPMYSRIIGESRTVPLSLERPQFFVVVYMHVSRNAAPRRISMLLGKTRPFIHTIDLPTLVRSTTFMHDLFNLLLSRYCWFSCFSAGFDVGPLTRYGDGARSRTLCGRQTQQNPTAPVFSEVQTSRYGSSEDITDLPRLGPAPHAANVTNHDPQSGLHGDGRARETRFYNRN